MTDRKQTRQNINGNITKMKPGFFWPYTTSSIQTNKSAEARGIPDSIGDDFLYETRGWEVI